jgi:hypothetical protein
VQKAKKWKFVNEMLQNGYYEVESSVGESCNTTPFSVKDILNLVEQDGEGYLGCQMEK